MIALVQ